MSKLKENRYNSRAPLHIGAVSFFNARPLIYQLENSPYVFLHCTVPSQLASGLDDGTFHAAMVPSIDYQTTPFDWAILPVGAIGSNGPVLTVQIFSRCPLEQINCLTCDTDSHTSVALAQVIWHLRYGRPLKITPLPDDFRNCQAILLIGDKVLEQLDAWPFQLDLGQAWTELTQLPFVNAFWAVRDAAHCPSLYKILRHAFRQGLDHIEQIIKDYSSQHGFDQPTARRYFAENICFDLLLPQQRGLQKFYELAFNLRLIPRLRPLNFYSPDSAVKSQTKTKSPQTIQP